MSERGRRSAGLISDLSIALLSAQIRVLQYDADQERLLSARPMVHPMECWHIACSGLRQDMFMTVWSKGQSFWLFVRVCPSMQVLPMTLTRRRLALVCGRSGHIRSQPLGHPAWRGAGAAGGAPRAHWHRTKVRCSMCRLNAHASQCSPGKSVSCFASQHFQHLDKPFACVAAVHSGIPLRTTWRSPLRRARSTGGTSMTRVCRCGESCASDPSVLL
jgi:hypothetical protein